MINFKLVKSIKIKEGSVVKITDKNGRILWSKGQDVYLNVNPTDLTLNKNGDTEHFSITSNISWSITNN